MYEKVIVIVPFIFCLIGSVIAFLFYRLFCKPDPFIGTPEVFGTVDRNETRSERNGGNVHYHEYYVIYFFTPEGKRYKGTVPASNNIKIGDTVKLKYILDDPNNPAKKLFKNVFGFETEPSAKIKVTEPKQSEPERKEGGLNLSCNFNRAAGFGNFRFAEALV